MTHTQLDALEARRQRWCVRVTCVDGLTIPYYPVIADTPREAMDKARADHALAGFSYSTAEAIVLERDIVV